MRPFIAPVPPLNSENVGEIILAIDMGLEQGFFSLLFDNASDIPGPLPRTGHSHTTVLPRGAVPVKPWRSSSASCGCQH